MSASSWIVFAGLAVVVDMSRVVGRMGTWDDQGMCERRLGSVWCLEVYWVYMGVYLAENIGIVFAEAGEIHCDDG